MSVNTNNDANVPDTENDGWIPLSEAPIGERGFVWIVGGNLLKGKDCTGFGEVRTYEKEGKTHRYAHAEGYSGDFKEPCEIPIPFRGL